MRRLLLPLAWFVLTGVFAGHTARPSALTPTSGQDRAQQLLELARQALGGEAKLKSVTSFVAKGSFQIHQPGRTGSSFEIYLELPDKFVLVTLGRADAPKLMNATPSDDVFGVPPGVFARGFNGQDIILSRVSAGESLTAPSVRRHYLASSHYDALRLLVAVFADSIPGIPVRFASPADSDADGSVIVSPDGQPPTRLWFDLETHLPTRFGPTEYQDYKTIDGLRVPFRLVAGPLTQQITSFRYNVAIDPKTFSPSHWTR